MYYTVTAKTLKPIAAVNEAILYTLIPQDVALAMSHMRAPTHTRLSSSHGFKERRCRTNTEMVAAHIGCTSIMFCHVYSERGGMLDASVTPPETAFAVLSDLFSRVKF